EAWTVGKTSLAGWIGVITITAAALSASGDPDRSVDGRPVTGPPSLESERVWRWGLLGLGAGRLFLRVMTFSPTPDGEDSVLFSRGVARFSVAETRPHWPGYPVYIAMGKLGAALLGDPVWALHLLSALSSALLAWPLGSIVRAWATALQAPRR